MSSNARGSVELDADAQQEPSINLDLTTNTESPKVFNIPRKKYDVQEARERVRSNIAISLIGLLGIVLIGSLLIFTFSSKSSAEVKDIMVVVYPPLIGIIGTVLGFYYGAEVAKTQDK